MSSRFIIIILGIVSVAFDYRTVWYAYLVARYHLTIPHQDGLSSRSSRAHSLCCL